MQTINIETINHPRYHKQCHCVEQPKNKKKDPQNSLNNMRCVDHNRNCSKTFWEWGWYQGERSKSL